MASVNQDGYAALLVIVIVVVVGGAGYYLYRHSSKNKSINSFDQCVKDGNPIQESYPEVCVTPEGRQFPNPNQSVEPPQ